MHLQALSVGAGVASCRFSGVVHSVFRQACNIRTAGGSLLTLLAPQLGNAPHGVRIELPSGFAFSDHLRAGQRVGCRAAVLRVAGAGFAVGLAGAKRWRSQLETLGIDLSRPEVALARQGAWQALADHRQRLGKDPFRDAVHTRGLALARASRALSVPEAAAAVRRLIGCGPGLTPAGDDLVVGFLGGIWSTRGGDPARRRFLDALGAIVTAAAEATGDISRAYLQHATLGSVAEPIARLSRAIGEGDLPEVERAAGNALRVGHTSGGDSVQGLLLGLVCWSERELAHG